MMRILLAQERTGHPYSMLTSLARLCCPLHLTVVDQREDLLQAAGKYNYDCVIIDASLLDNKTTKRLQETMVYRLSQPTLVILGEIFENISLPILPNQIIHRINLHDGVDWNACAKLLGASIPKTESTLNRQPDHLISSKRTPPKPNPFIDITRNDRVDPNFLNLSENRSRHGHHTCILMSVDASKTVVDHHRAWTTCHNVIQSVSNLLGQRVREPNMLVRWSKNQFLIIRPDCTLVDAWIWSERMKRSIEQSSFDVKEKTDKATIHFGIVNAETRDISLAIVDQAGQALRRAQQQDHSHIYTADMLAIERIIKCPTVMKETTLSRRRTAFLAKSRHLLGPVQFDHLTVHAERVSQVALRVAQKMALPIKDIYRIRMAALLHDIGKCLIPEQVLAKPSALSIEEYQLMSLHAPLGARLAEELGANEAVTAMIFHHHTRFDRHRAAGSHQVRSPLGARVLCAADAFVTMTSDRTYRPAHCESEAMHELRRQRGSQFDPDVVDAIERIGLSFLSQAA